MENKNNQSLNINKIDELKKLKILNSTLIKELRKYIDKNAKLQQEKELLYGNMSKRLWTETRQFGTKNSTQ